MIFLQVDSSAIIRSFEDSWHKFIDQIPGYLTAILLIAIGVFLSNKLSSLSKRVIAGRTGDPLMTNFLSKTIKLMLIIVVLMFALRIAGLQGIANTLLTAAGASAVIIGFAFRDIGENFISGIILSFNRPFNINDTIQSGDVFGKVQAMEFRYTKVKTFDGRDVYVPNSDVLKKPLINYTEDGFIRMDFTVGIDYDDNLEKAEEVVLDSILKTSDILQDQDHYPFVVAELLDVSSITLRVFFWVDSENYRKKALQIKSRVIGNVKAAILENGLNIPTNIHEIKLYGSRQNIPVELVRPEKASDQSEKRL